jgi:hypothetical protein
MYTKSYPVYNFAELSEEVKEKALDNLRDINVDFDDWHDFMLEEFEVELTALGYIDPEIGYRGFYSQGDGAHFTASVDVEKWIKSHHMGREFPALLRYAKKGGYISAGIVRSSSFYDHEYTISAEIELDSDASEKAELESQRFENAILEDAREQSRKIYRRLEKEYEYLTSDEAVKETIEANEYTFTKSGKLDNIDESQKISPVGIIS